MLYLFGEYRLDDESFELRCCDERCQLEPKAFNVLLYLIQHRERIVLKNELLEQLWDRQFISDAALNSCVMSARRAVGDNGTLQRVIQTHRSRGYRFVASVEVHPAPVHDASAPTTLPVANGQGQSDSFSSLSTNGRHLEGPDASHLDGHQAADNVADEQYCPDCSARSSREALYCEACGYRLTQVCPHCAHLVSWAALYCSECGQCLSDPTIVETPAESWVGVPLIGRDEELQRLQGIFHQAMTGTGQVVEIRGAAGIGKSRLLSAFQQAVSHRAIPYVQGYCPAVNAAPGTPMRDILRQSFGVTEVDSIERVQRRVAMRLQPLGLDVEAEMPYLLNFMSGRAPVGHLAAQEPRLVKVRTLHVLRRFFIACSQLQPVVVVIEDVHRIDRLSVECLLSLVEGIADLPVLLLMTCRTETQPDWLSAIAPTSIVLTPFVPQDRVRLAQAILGGEAVPRFLEQGLSSTAGHPGFVAELVRWYIAGGKAADGLPVSLSDAVRARLAQLPPHLKGLLDAVAVWGQVVPYSVLRQLWASAADIEAVDLDTVLLELEERAFCERSDNLAEPAYCFAYDALRELVYEQVSEADRHLLHAAATVALESLPTDRLEPVTGLLAWHQSQAEEPAQAVSSLTQVLRQAMQWGDYATALSTIDVALARLDGLPDQAVVGCELKLQQVRSLLGLGAVQESLEFLEAPLLELELGLVQSDRLSGQRALLLGQAYSQLDRWQDAIQAAQAAVIAAERGHDEMTAGCAHHLLAMAHYRLGDPVQGTEYSRQAVGLLESPEARQTRALAYFVLGLNCAMGGDFAEALSAEAEALAIGIELEDPQLLVSTSWATGWIQAAQGHCEAAIGVCREALNWAFDPLSQAFVRGWLGYAYLENADSAAAIPHLEHALETMQQVGYQRMEGLYSTFLGWAHLAQEGLDTARELALQGMALAQATEDGFAMGWGLRVLGQIDTHNDKLDEAHDHLSQALQVFLSLNASFEAARTQFDLANLMLLRADAEVAASHARDAYCRFTALKVPIYIQRLTVWADTSGISL